MGLQLPTLFMSPQTRSLGGGGEMSNFFFRRGVVYAFCQEKAKWLSVKCLVTK